MTYILSPKRPLSVLSKLFIECMHLSPEQVKVSGDPAVKSAMVEFCLTLNDEKTESLGHEVKTQESSDEFLVRKTQTWILSTISVHAFSKSQEAIDRKEELLSSLLSFQALEAMQDNNMQFQLQSEGINVSTKFPFKDGWMNCVTFPIEILWAVEEKQNIPFITAPFHSFQTISKS